MRQRQQRLNGLERQRSIIAPLECGYIYQFCDDNVIHWIAPCMHGQIQWITSRRDWLSDLQLSDMRQPILAERPDNDLARFLFCNSPRDVFLPSVRQHVQTFYIDAHSVWCIVDLPNNKLHQFRRGLKTFFLFCRSVASPIIFFKQAVRSALRPPHTPAIIVDGADSPYVFV